MDSSILEEYHFLFGGGDWVLVGDESLPVPANYTIYNVRTSQMLLVEVDSLNRDLCSEMKRRGARVIPRIPKRQISIGDLPIES
jgi:hypothetical protein